MIPKNKLLYVFGIFMLLIYWGMAYLLVFSPVFTERIPQGRYVLGGVLFVYGVYRAYRQLRTGRYGGKNNDVQ